MVAEGIKLVVSGAISVVSSSKNDHHSSWPLKLLGLLWNGRKVIILVILYSVSNTIPLYAISRIGAPLFTVCIQLKIFTTAMFASFFLKREYSSAKWRAILLLIVGCILVASPIFSRHQSPLPLSPPTPSPTMGAIEGQTPQKEPVMLDNSQVEAVLGLAAVLVQTLISGFSAVYFESLLKDKEDSTTIWERNFQLAGFSLLVLGTYLCSEAVYSSFSTNPLVSAQLRGDSQTVSVKNTPLLVLFEGWTGWTVLIAVLNGAGGLLVAATLKYADAVLKCFATAVSIIITSIVGYLFLGNDIDVFVALGMVVTVISIFNYTLDYQQLTK